MKPVGESDGGCSMSRRAFLHAGGAAVLVRATTRAQAAGPSRRPNIVVMVSDDQGWADIGYHNEEIRSPNMDRLARTGVELDCHYVQPQCTPTRVALMTGRYPSRFGAHCTQASNAQSYPIGTLTMASMLKPLGYETAMTGKWHMGSRFEWGPNHYGFDHSHGSLAGAVGMYDHRYRTGSPFSRTWHRNHESIDQEGHVTDLCAEEAVGWIEREREAPFFLYVPFHAVHTPVVEHPKWLRRNGHIDDPDRRLFAAAVTHLDDAIGRIVEALERTGQRDDTLIIFTSDNGGIHGRYGGGNYPSPDVSLAQGFSSNAPLRGGKSTAYEGGMRVPAFVNWPGVLERSKVNAPMHAVDWMPTLAMLLGYVPDEEPLWDGADVWPFITARESVEDRTLYWVWGGGRWEALRHGRWKVVRNGQQKLWELYDLLDDPCEETNLAAEQTEKLKELVTRYEAEKAKDAL